jgi:hypothetical protein
MENEKKVYRTIDEQIDYLVENKNIDRDTIDRDKLCDISYMSLITPYTTLICKGRDSKNHNKHIYDQNINFNYYINWYNIDKYISSKLQICIGDFERISDHALNILDAAKEMNDKKMVFSESANKELKIFSNAIKDIVKSTVIMFEENDLSLASLIEPMEEVIDNLSDELKNRHIKRLKENKCTIELGFVFSDITTNFERISDHCSNIAVCLIEVNQNEFETHEYLEFIKHDSADFKEKYNVFKGKYILP